MVLWLYVLHVSQISLYPHRTGLLLAGLESELPEKYVGNRHVRFWFLEASTEAKVSFCPIPVLPP